MKKLLVVLLLFVLMGSVGFAQSTDCSDTMKHYFGPYCINPVTFNLQGFYPIGSYIEFHRPDNTTDIGKVTGYSWQPQLQAFAYYTATSPFYQLVPNGISGINEVVYVEYVFAASEPAYNGQSN